MRHLQILILVVAAILVFLLRELFSESYKTKRHRRKVAKAKQVLKKLIAFDGQYRNARILSYLRKIDPYVFEELLLCAFETNGFKIKRNRSYSGDGGFDGTVFNEVNQKYYIQAKRYKGIVSTKHVNDFSILVQEHHAVGGFFIHTGRTPSKTLDTFRSGNINIISGDKLINLITTSNFTLTVMHLNLN